MSLRCSLLGHEFGDSEIERDREERGNEVIISVVELERCTRCRKARTISENTEVTQLSGDESDALDATSRPEPDSPDSRGEPKPAGFDSDPDSGTGIRPRPETVPETETEFGADPSIETDPTTEDTEIIEEGPDDDRESGAWPDVADHNQQRSDSSAGWPTVEGEDEGFDATTPDGTTDIEFGGGLTPQADQGAEIIETDDSSAEGGSEAAFVSVEPIATPDQPGEERIETELFCPHCETTLDERDSLRAGDICPECHRGYLAEREA